LPPEVPLRPLPPVLPPPVPPPPPLPPPPMKDFGRGPRPIAISDSAGLASALDAPVSSFDMAAFSVVLEQLRESRSGFEIAFVNLHF